MSAMFRLWSEEGNPVASRVEPEASGQVGLAAISPSGQHISGHENSAGYAGDMGSYGPEEGGRTRISFGEPQIFDVEDLSHLVHQSSNEDFYENSPRGVAERQGKSNQKPSSHGPPTGRGRDHGSAAPHAGRQGKSRGHRKATKRDQTPFNPRTLSSYDADDTEDAEQAAADTTKISFSQSPSEKISNSGATSPTNNKKCAFAGEAPADIRKSVEYLASGSSSLGQIHGLIQHEVREETPSFPRQNGIKVSSDASHVAQPQFLNANASMQQGSAVRQFAASAPQINAAGEYHPWSQSQPRSSGVYPPPHGGASGTAFAPEQSSYNPRRCGPTMPFSAEYNQAQGPGYCPQPQYNTSHFAHSSQPFYSAPRCCSRQATWTAGEYLNFDKAELCRRLTDALHEVVYKELRPDPIREIVEHCFDAVLPGFQDRSTCCRPGMRPSAYHTRDSVHPPQCFSAQPSSCTSPRPQPAPCYQSPPHTQQSVRCAQMHHSQVYNGDGQYGVARDHNVHNPGLRPGEMPGQCRDHGAYVARPEIVNPQSSQNVPAYHGSQYVHQPPNMDCGMQGNAGTLNGQRSCEVTPSGFEAGVQVHTETTPAAYIGRHVQVPDRSNTEMYSGRPGNEVGVTMAPTSIYKPQDPPKMTLSLPHRSAHAVKENVTQSMPAAIKTLSPRKPSKRDQTPFNPRGRNSGFGISFDKDPSTGDDEQHEEVRWNSHVTRSESHRVEKDTGPDHESAEGGRRKREVTHRKPTKRDQTPFNRRNFSLEDDDDDDSPNDTSPHGSSGNDNENGSSSRGRNSVRIGTATKEITQNPTKSGICFEDSATGSQVTQESEAGSGRRREARFSGAPSVSIEAPAARSGIRFEEAPSSPREPQSALASESSGRGRGARFSESKSVSFEDETEKGVSFRPDRSKKPKKAPSKRDQTPFHPRKHYSDDDDESDQENSDHAPGKSSPQNGAIDIPENAVADDAEAARQELLSRIFSQEERECQDDEQGSLDEQSSGEGRRGRSLTRKLTSRDRSPLHHRSSA